MAAVRGRAQVGVVVLLLAAPLAGCTQDEPGPEVTAPTFVAESPEPTVSSAAPSASAEPSPEPTVAAPPPLPDLATQQTPEGAVAFTQWWFETLNYATATGDTAGLRAASDPGCETCNSFLGEIEAAYEGGGRIEGGLFTVQVDPVRALEPLGVRVAVFAGVTATAILDPDDEPKQSFAAEETAIVFTALLANQGWVAGGLA